MERVEWPPPSGWGGWRERGPVGVGPFSSLGREDRGSSLKSGERQDQVGEQLVGSREEAAMPPPACLRQPGNDACLPQTLLPWATPALLPALSGTHGWHTANPKGHQGPLSHPCPPKETITKCCLEPLVISSPSPHLQGRLLNPVSQTWKLRLRESNVCPRSHRV